LGFNKWDAGRLVFGKRDAGRLVFSKWDAGRLGFNKWDAGRLGFNKWDAGRFLGWCFAPYSTCSVYGCVATTVPFVDSTSAQSE